MSETSEMVERVARAIYASHAFNDNHDSLNPGFDGLSEGWRNVMLAGARAAIEAMREPLGVDLRDQELRLRMGEMTAAEMRTLRAFIGWQRSKIDAALPNQDTPK